ncbi:MAG: hypothetical protein J6N32_07530, partial [Clostridia bacterium]|nr:hypothetical protein [Clostridia bacterium]
RRMAGLRDLQSVRHQPGTARLCRPKRLPDRSRKQGYTGCSCLVTGDAVYTFDRGIVKSLRREDIPYVLLEEGGISLPGYDCGFLGGACGYHDGTIVVCGNADLLPCAAALHNAGSVFSLSDTPVTDYGGIKIYQRN